MLVAQDIRSGAAERGILVCGSGVGVSVAANKFKGFARPCATITTRPTRAWSTTT